MTYEEVKAACIAYGIHVRRMGGWFTWHNVAGVLGPFDNETEAWEIAYNRWVKGE